MYNYMKANVRKCGTCRKREREMWLTLNSLLSDSYTKDRQRERVESNYTCCCDESHLRANMAPMKPQMTAHLFIVQMCLFLLVKVNESEMNDASSARTSVIFYNQSWDFQLSVSHQYFVTEKLACHSCFCLINCDQNVCFFLV